jgi:hypothetical protein
MREAGDDAAVWTGAKLWRSPYWDRIGGERSRFDRSP